MRIQTAFTVCCLCAVPECPTCYGLVQDAVNVHRKELSDLEEMIANADQLPGDNTNNAEFKKELDALNETAHQLLDRALQNQSESEFAVMIRFLCL